MPMKATNFKFDQKTSELLDTLKKDSDASSKAEVIRMALKLLNAANKAKHKNQKLIFRDEITGKETEIII